MEPPAHTLLEPGHEDTWARLNTEKRELLTPAPDTPIEELLRRGQHLSAQAAGLLRAIERAGDSTVADLDVTVTAVSVGESAR